MTFKITKFVHSCLLVETPDRVALFDPGGMSVSAINLDDISKLDDVFITHSHGDHLDVDFLKKVVAKFPDVRITAPNDVVEQLSGEGIKATSTPPEGVTFFDSPHESTAPLFPQPEEIGIHYLDALSDPGDSHSFNETKSILALPVTAPWGANIKAVNLALELKPKHVLPIHDWHWSDQARAGSYDLMEQHFSKAGITFHKLETGVPVEIEV
jgi:L-ascorbate metabolism protein UlaG (beta-lactamase superfamily)